MARKKNSPSLIVLTENVGVENAAGIKEQLLTSITKNEVTSVDISEITDIDTSILQLFIAAALEAKKQNKQFYVLDNIPQNVCSLLELLSLKLPLQDKEA